MALIDTVETSNVTVPTFLAGYKNGELPSDILRCPDLDRTSTSDVWKMFVPVSWAWTAMQIAAKADGHILDTTGRYRSAARQEALFRERYKPGEENNDGCGSKLWQGQRWYLQRSDKGGCMAMAATPGTSNHGLGLADDIAEDPDQFDGTGVVSLDDPTLIWLRDNAADFGIGLETHKERWHWHWIGGNALSQRVVDVLRAAGLTIPDLSGYGFTVPPPPDTGDDEVTEQDKQDIIDGVYARLMKDTGDDPTVSQSVWWTKTKVTNEAGQQVEANIFSIIGWSYGLLMRIVKKLGA